MGTNMIYHLAGGEPGMRHMLAQFGPCLKWPWTKLEAPELTEQLIDRMVEGTQAQAGGRSIRELERLRDDYLVAIQQVLRQHNIGAGATLKAIETRLYEEAAAKAPAAEAGKPLRLLETEVRPEWVDYNGHMSDFRYPQLFGDATDALFRRVGVDDAYRASGRMYYTVESHLTYGAEAKAMEPLYVTTQVVGVDEKRLHLFHSLHRRRDDQVVATGEQMYVHVATADAKASPVDATVRAKLAVLQAAHARLPAPKQKGRSVGLPKG
jgi:carnitine 3-dehydrogenase